MPLRILVVEDHAPFRHLSCTALQRRAEFQTIEAADGLEAVQKAEELQPDLILLDINLPKMHGFDVAKQVHRLAPHARLLFMSQESSSDIVREALSVGAHGYIQKLSAATDLLPAIDAVLGGQRFVSRSLAFTWPLEREVRVTEDEPNVLPVAADITDLTRAEEIRAQYAAIVESSHDAIIAKNLDGVISAWNAAAERMFGYAEREAIGQPITMIIPPDLYDDEHDILRRLRAGERVEHYETVRVTKAGKRIDVSLTISPLRDRAGRIIGFSKIARDITEAKQTEAALRESEEHFRLAMNVASGVYTLDLNGLVTYVNRAAETMFGWTNAELIGRKMHDVTHYKYPDGSPFPASECSGLQVLQQGVELREHEDTFIRKDGSCFPVVYSASPLTTEGRTVGIVVGFRDDTQRREVERALRQSEKRFRLMTDCAPVMVWMSGPDKLSTYSNRRSLEFTGRQLEAELGNGWMDSVHPDHITRCIETYTKAFDQRLTFEMEFRLRRHDGEYRWVLSRGVPMFNSDGSFAGYIGSAIDITDRKLAEEALFTVSQKLIEAHEEESTRIARELHDDICQQLAMVSMRLGGLKQSPPASAAEFTQEIGAASEEIANLASDIQALSHRLHPSRLELLGLEAAVGGLCNELSHRQGVQIDVHLENIPTGLSREIAVCLYRVLQEALQNAVKHSGSPRAQVSITGGVDNIILTVEDSGVGFDSHGAMRDNALGLTSMKERLRLVGGQLSIHSQRGRGTTIQAVAPLCLPTMSANAV